MILAWLCMTLALPFDLQEWRIACQSVEKSKKEQINCSIFGKKKKLLKGNSKSFTFIYFLLTVLVLPLQEVLDDFFWWFS
jgi:hypothetical protein